jgi:hypothetical protein
VLPHEVTDLAQVVAAGVVPELAEFYLSLTLLDKRREQAQVIHKLRFSLAVHKRAASEVGADGQAVVGICGGVSVRAGGKAE